MRSRASSAARTSREWAIRALLAVALGLIGVKALALTWAQVMAVSDPEIAHRLAPADGRIAGRLAASLVEADAANARWERPRAIAVRALSEDPTAIGAVSTLGLDAMLRGDAGMAAQRFAYAQRLTRRDPRTQLWAIEDAVGRGDVPATLRNYDISLRTRPEMATVLFPVLASAMVDGQVREALIRLLATRPVWGADFADFAVRDGSARDSLPPLLLGLVRAGVPVTPGAHRTAIDHLFQRHAFQEAWNYYHLLHPDAEQRRSRDPNFKGDSDAALPFDWNLANEGGASASLGNGAFEWSVAPSMGADLLRQMLVLPSGVYRLSGHGTGVDEGESQRPYWTLRCADGRELGRIVLPPSSQSAQSYIGNFVVPANCPVQQLLLIARAVNNVAGASGTIDRVQLEPVK